MLVKELCEKTLGKVVKHDNQEGRIVGYTPTTWIIKGVVTGSIIIEVGEGAPPFSWVWENNGYTDIDVLLDDSGKETKRYYYVPAKYVADLFELEVDVEPIN